MEIEPSVQIISPEIEVIILSSDDDETNEDASETQSEPDSENVNVSRDASEAGSENGREAMSEDSSVHPSQNVSEATSSREYANHEQEEEDEAMSEDSSEHTSQDVSEATSSREYANHEQEEESIHNENSSDYSESILRDSHEFIDYFTRSQRAEFFRTAENGGNQQRCVTPPQSIAENSSNQTNSREDDDELLLTQRTASDFQNDNVFHIHQPSTSRSSLPGPTHNSFSRPVPPRNLNRILQPQHQTQTLRNTPAQRRDSIAPRRLPVNNDADALLLTQRTTHEFEHDDVFQVLSPRTLEEFENIDVLFDYNQTPARPSSTRSPIPSSQSRHEADAENDTSFSPYYRPASPASEV